MPIGIAITNDLDELSIIGHNKAVLDILLESAESPQSAGKPEFLSYTGSRGAQLKKALLQHHVNLVTELTTRVPFGEFVQKAKGREGDCHGFLEVADRLIEVKARKGIYDDQDVTYLTFVDCSLAQKLEKARAENQYKTLVMSTVSHELRTPVNAILGSLENIKQYIPSERQNFVQLAINSCHMLSFQINDLTV